MLSLVIPVYKNEENLDRLLAALADLSRKFAGQLEVVFVVDGSPDRCLEILRKRLPAAPMQSRLISLSRNFGSFQAVTAGLKLGRGEYFAVLAADLQEPPELILQFWDILRKDEADIVFGCRSRRADPWLSELFSNLFWNIYRLFVVKNMPKGGIDIFGCTRQVRDRLVEFKENVHESDCAAFLARFSPQVCGIRKAGQKRGQERMDFRQETAVLPG